MFIFSIFSFVLVAHMERDWILSVLSDLIGIRAVNPLAGGNGEKERADYIEGLLEKMGFHVKRFDVKDEKGFIRSNILVDYGDGEPLWMVAHLDTVSAGEGWTSDPFKLRVENGKVFGRGVSDNGIGIVSLLLILKWISEGKLSPKKRLLLLFAADEEAGSRYGVKYLAEKGVFKERGSAIIPDFGSKSGELIEIAEKGIVWLKVVTKGKQGHASMPHKADNAHLKSARLMLKLYDALHMKFYRINYLFDPPYSTFEPTKKDRNVDSINIIPGVDTVYWDCRILPEYRIEDVLEFFRGMAKRYDADIEVIMCEEPSMTNPSEKIVVDLKKAVKTELNIEPKVIGIGGGTVAGILRKLGIPAVAWSICSETEHKANEYELIENYIKTARVLARVTTF